MEAAEDLLVMEATFDHFPPIPAFFTLHFRFVLLHSPHFRERCNDSINDIHVCCWRYGERR